MGDISSTIHDTCCLHIEDVLDDVSSYDEDIDQMEKVLSDQYMEQTNQDQGKMKSLEDIKQDPLLEHVQHPCTKVCDLEDNEVEFPH